MLRYGLSVLMLVGSMAAQAAGDPEALVRETAEEVLAQIETRRAELQQNTAGIFKLVREKVIAHFDFERMTQIALGRYWRDADADQRSRLTAEFEELLVRTYAVALLNYSGDPIEYPGARVDDARGQALVPTRVSDGKGPKVPIDYRLYASEAGDWLVYDVVIDGVSLVSNYRTTFAQEVQRGGVEGLIGSLAERNKKLRG